MNTTLEIPEGSKATIQGKVIDGKNYLVVEVEREPKTVTYTTGTLVTEIAELQRQIDERDRLLEHIFFVLKGDVTRRIMRTDVPLAAQIVDLLVEVMANKKQKHSAPQSGL